MWNKILRFLGWKDTIQSESIAQIEERIKSTEYTRNWLLVCFFIIVGAYIITRGLSSLILAGISLNFMNSLHISQKQDRILLKIIGEEYV